MWNVHIYLFKVLCRWAWDWIIPELGAEWLEKKPVSIMHKANDPRRKHCTVHCQFYICQLRCLAYISGLQIICTNKLLGWYGSLRWLELCLNSSGLARKEPAVLTKIIFCSFERLNSLDGLPIDISSLNRLRKFCIIIQTNQGQFCKILKI